MHFTLKGRRRVMVVVGLGLSCCLIAGAGVPAEALLRRPGPSADEVAEAMAKARERSKQLSTTTVLLAEAQANLDGLVAEAEKLIELYNGERVKTLDAQNLFEQANKRAADAGAEVEKAREAVAAITAQSYGGLDLAQPMMAMMADLGGSMDQNYLHRASILAHMGGGHAEMLRQLRDSQEVFAILQGQAEDAYARQKEAEGRAETAKKAAEEAVARQLAATQRIKREQALLTRQADEARSTADRLARERAAELERARIARERAAQERRQAAAVARETARMGTPGAGLALGATSSRGDIAADWALTQLNKPYVWAAAGPDTYDCSGLTMRAWEQVGITLDHWTGTQWTAGPHVPLSQLNRGDLLFFGRITQNPGDIHHVGIYIGRGQMVHAPQTGDVVRVAPAWRSDLVGATRPV
ncbi:C40 family peptidase [Streptosporangium lutulentum]|uniref:Cell wall-associated NlpC family hydrolase n=1 Tax=Streptosporangium lutulentum TaxID=1461250 RepID=A0ABT9QP75_9ACTN|nr:C40 family peptidase [Streptosporangium lutulentum]MDP9848195.1 cell wall-associated NlpC family hydrolase [Streptosporangium lutulentum]